MKADDLIGKGYPVKDTNNQIFAIRTIIDAWDYADGAGYIVQIIPNLKVLNSLSYEQAARIVEYKEWQDLPRLDKQ